MENSKKIDTQKLALLALLTALTAVLAYLGGFVKIGGFASISLTLIPVVIGAALCSAGAGAWLGGVSGAVFFLTADAAFWMGMSPFGTVLTVMVKGIMAGLCAGLVYKLFEKVNRYLAVILSAIVCPVVNTSIFIGGCFVFFMDAINTGAAGEGMSVWGYILVFFVGFNFIFELLANIILSPVILRLINIRNGN